MQLPDVMVLVFDERLGHSMWQDYYPKSRTLRGLIRHMAGEVKAGRFVGYRLIRTELEITGVCPVREREFLERQS